MPIFRFSLAAALMALLPALTPPANAQTKPRVEVPAEDRRQARAIVKRLLREGKIMRTSDVKRGMRGVGRSVFLGNKIEEFPVEVLGVLERVSGGGDIVLIRVLGGTVVQRHSGIIAGMSGSPVYIKGKMIGAISMGWGFPKEPIGGVTPITEMIETSLPDPAHAKVTLPAPIKPPAATTPATKPPATVTPAALRPTAASAYSAASAYRPTRPLRIAGHRITRVLLARPGQQHAALEGTAVMHPVSTVLQLSGFNARSLPRWRKLFEPYGIEPVMGPSSHKAGVSPPMKPGSAIGVQLVSGDMDQTAVGTVTFRWGQRVLAFGHPMFGQGAASLPIATSFVHDIFPSYERSFKLASPVNVVGALQQDTQFAIGGTIGMTADTIPMTLRLRHAARQIAHTYHVRVMKDPVLTPNLIAMVASEAIETTLGVTSDKMVRIGLNMEIEGSNPIHRTNYLYARDAVTMPALNDLLQSLSITQMNEFERAGIKRVDLDVSIEEGRKTARIKRLVADRNRVKAGETLQVTVGLEPIDSPGKIINRTFDIAVPADTPTGEMRIGAASGASYWALQMRVGGPPPEPTNLYDLITAFGRIGSANELLVDTSTYKAFAEIDQQTIPNPPPAWSKLMRTSRSSDIGFFNEVAVKHALTDFVLTGGQVITIPVEGTRPREKTAPRPTPAITKTETTETTGTTATTTTTTTTSGDAGDEAAARLHQWPWSGEETDQWAHLWNSADVSGAAGSAALDDLHSLMRNAPFLRLLREVRAGTALADSPLPPVTKPDKPVVSPVKPTGPLPTPGPTPTPAPTPTPTPAPSTKNLVRPSLSWVQDSPSDFLGGDFERTLVNNEGQVKLAPPQKLLATTAQPFVWSVAGDAQGNSYLGTGPQAKIIRIAPDGHSTNLYEGKQVTVGAMTTDAAGNLYAGLSPGGSVYRFGRDGKRSLIFDSAETFVWALEWDASGRLLVGTGGATGRLYRMPDAATRTEAGNASALQVAQFTQKHVRAIAVQGNDLYVGTGDEGVLYRVDAATGVATALYQAALTGGKAADAEVLAVAASPEGIYFGTSQNGTLYRWNAAGVTEMYASPQHAIYALRRSAQGKLFAATGDQGIVYQIDPGTNSNDTRVARLLEPSQLQALALALTPTGQLLVGTGNNGAAYQLALGDAHGGSFTSAIFDAKNVVRWGAARPLARGASIDTRSGNTVYPDKSWSGWNALRGNDLGEFQVASPAARYLQYRVRLQDVPNAKDSNFGRLEVIYRPPNSAPTVSLTDPKGGEYWSGKDKKIKWTGKDPDSDTLRYRLWISHDDGKTWEPLGKKPDSEIDGSSFEFDTTKFVDGTYLIKVEANDAVSNPDDPKRDESISEPIIIDNTPPHLSAVNLAAQPNGDLLLNAVASDDASPVSGVEWRVVAPDVKPAAGGAAASTAAILSKGAIKVPAGKLPVPAAITPAAITPAKVDEPKADWRAAAAVDGIFDSRREAITALIPATTITHPRLEIRVRDAAGNTSTTTINLPH